LGKPSNGYPHDGRSAGLATTWPEFASYQQSCPDGVISLEQVTDVDPHELTPPYFRWLVHLIRPFPNFDLFFVRELRQRAVHALQLGAGSRVLDVGCGPGGSFPYLVEAVGPSGEVVGVEISPEVSLNARRRIEANRWSNVQVVEGDAKTVQLNGAFDAMLLLGAPDAYASREAVDNLLRYMKDDARIVAFGAKLSHHPLGKLLNWLSRSLMKLSFSSTPKLSYEPWCVLEKRLAEVQVQEYSFGCMFLAWGSIRSSSSTIDKSPLRS
jgi:precorrin-6B methylase 2